MSQDSIFHLQIDKISDCLILDSLFVLTQNYVWFLGFEGSVVFMQKLLDRM